MAEGPKWTDIAIVILTIGIVFFALMQWLEMRGSGQQTDKLLAYAKVQANAASDIGDAAQQFSDTAEETNNGISEAVDQLQAAAENTRTTIRNAQQAFRDEQRAWLGMSFVQHDGSPEIKADTDVIFTATLNNTGRTPALYTKPLIHWRLMGPNDPLVSGNLVGPQGSAVVFPNAPQGLATEPIRFSQPDIDGMKGGVTVFRIWGEIPYDDVYRRPHWTHFCAFVGKNIKDIYSCDHYNETDDKAN